MVLSRNVIAFILAGLTILLAGRIPLPGIDWMVIQAQMTSGNGSGMARVSLFVLGLMPIYSALAFVEIGRLFMRPRGQEAAPSSGFGWLLVCLIALAFTGLQAYGIAVALENYGMIANGFDLFIPVTVATCLATTAGLIFLIGRVRLDGFTTGFWALFSIPAIMGLFAELANTSELLTTGAISLGACFIALAHIVLCVAGVVFITSLWDGLARVPAANATPITLPRGILIWPPVLAYFVVETILTIAALAPPSFLGSLGEEGLRVAVIVITLLLIPIFVFAYVRQCRPQIAPTAPLALVALSIAVTQVILIVSIIARDALLPVPFGLEPAAIMALALTAIGIGGVKLPALNSEKRGGTLQSTAIDPRPLT
jgi:preprotein translocase subunit SecY